MNMSELLGVQFLVHGNSQNMVAIIIHYGNPLQYSCLGNPMDGEPGGLQSRGLFTPRGSHGVGHN